MIAWRLHVDSMLMKSRKLPTESLRYGAPWSQVAIVIFAALCMGDTTRPACLLGLILALGGNLIYLLSRLQVRWPLMSD